MAHPFITTTEVFDDFPEPVLLLRAQLCVYCNRAAQRFFPKLEAGRAAPAALLAAIAGAGVPCVLSAELLGTLESISLQETADGTLVVLRAAQTQSIPQLARLTSTLRQQTATLAAALQQLGPVMPRAEPYLAAANQGLYRLLRTFGHLDFLQQDDVAIYTPAALELSGFLGALATELLYACESVGLRFSYADAGQSLLTTGDAVLLRRAILALVSNAIKAARTGSDLRLTLKKQHERAVITLSGTEKSGVSDLSQLFVPADARTPTLAPNEGLGLDVAAVQRIARLHGGALVATPRAEGGLRLVLSLPLIPPTNLNLRRPAQEQSGGFSPLLVELADVLPASLYATANLE